MSLQLAKWLHACELEIEFAIIVIVIVGVIEIAEMLSVQAKLSDCVDKSSWLSETCSRAE